MQIDVTPAHHRAVLDGREQFLAAPSDRWSQLIRTYLQQRIAMVLHANEAHIADDSNILDLGMDSLMVVEVLNDCKRDLQITLYPREFYERPAFGKLVRYLAAEFERAHGQGSATAPAAEPGFQAPGAWSHPPDMPAVVHTPGARNQGIVLLLSSPRSGSTLLRVMLAGHPALFCPPELHLLPFNSMARWGDQLRQQYLGEGLQRALMELIELDASTSKAMVEDLVAQDQPIQQVYALLQQLAGPRLLVDKSPSYAASLATLRRAEALFEGARYIHLVRHPYAVVESFVRNRMGKLLGADDRDPYGLAEQVWTTTNQNIRRLLQEIAPERQHLVCYEDLVRAPESVMRDLCAFLGVPFDPAVLNPYAGRRMIDGVHPTSAAIGDPNFLNHKMIDPALGEAWRSIALPALLGPPARRLAAELGYKLPQEAAAPPATAPLAVATPEMQEQYMEVRGLRLCLCAWGPQDGPLVLCLHGALEHGASWELVATALARQGYRVVAPDLRGHGRSEHVGRGGSYQLLDFLGDVDALTRALGRRSFTLVGHSMGAVIAALFAGTRPQQAGALVLVELPVPKERPDSTALDQLAVQLDYLASLQPHPIFPDLAAAADRLRRSTPSLTEAQVLRMAERLARPCEGGVCWSWDPLLRTRAGLGFDGMAFTPAMYTDMLARITAPTTLVYSAGSRFDGAAARDPQQLVLPEARRVVLPGGHNLHFDAPDALAAIIAEVGMF